MNKYVTLVTQTIEVDVEYWGEGGIGDCQHDSGVQAALFGEAISGAKCTNGDCFKQKTEGALTGLAEGMADEYPTIKIVRAGENFKILKVVSDGDNGVGERQAQACRGCAKYCTAISAIPGSIGKIYRNQCFDHACNTAKVAERIKAEKAGKAAAVESTKADKGGNTKSAAKTPAAKKLPHRQKHP